jgi:hypothetical protein
VRIANLALVITIATGIAANWQTIVSMLSSWVIFTVLVVIAVALGAGWLLGGRNTEARTTTTLVSGMRFASLGLIIIGTQLDGDPDYLGPCVDVRPARLSAAARARSRNRPEEGNRSPTRRGRTYSSTDMSPPEECALGADNRLPAPT